MQLGTALNLPNPRINFGATNKVPFKGENAIFTFTANALDPRITFSRTSNATVTNSAGLITYAPHNLLTFSEQFDNAAWQKFAASITANTTIAPDGTATSDKLIESSGAAAEHGTNRTAAVSILAGSQITLSVYSKADTRNRVSINIVNGAYTIGARYTFNLTTGTVGAVLLTGSPISHSASIQSVGNGWYRCIITVLLDTSSTTANFNIATDNGSTFFYAGDGTSGLFIWGAQLEQNSTATIYNPTTVKNLLGFTQEFDNAAWTKSNSFVQSNFILRSEEFDNTIWTASAAGVTVTPNTNIAPNNTNTADFIVENSGTSSHLLVQGTSAISGQITYSVYAKAGVGNRYLTFSVSRASTHYASATFDLSTKTETQTLIAGYTGSVTTSVVAAENGFYRYSFTVTTDTLTDFRIGLSATSTFTNFSRGFDSYTGNGSNSIIIWGAQLVQGSVAGDYVRTSSTVMPVMYQAPNSTLSADKLVEDTATNTHAIQQSANVTSGASYTLSCYAKAGERNFVQLLMLGGFASNITAIFDLTTGAVGTTVGSPITQAVNVGNGWWRFSITATANTTTATATQIRPASTSSSAFYAGDGTSGIYIWGAQLSDSASLDPYVYNPVASPTAQAYYAPRFDYDPVTLQPKGLLIEEQRTNLILQSEAFDNASWTKSNVTTTANTAIAPTGTTVADSITPQVTTNLFFTQQVVTTSISTIYTWSVYVKANGFSWIFLDAFDGTNHRTWFDIANGVVGTVEAGNTSTITSVGNGWYRCTLTRSSAAVSTNYAVAITSGNNALATTGNGTSGIFAWGAQLEAGAFATSYIPTVASQVTRAADTAVIQGSNFSSWYNQNEGTMYAEITYTGQLIGSVSATNIIRIDDSTANNQIDWRTVRDVSPAVDVVVLTNSNVQMDSSGLSPVIANTKYKRALAYAINNAIPCNNGILDGATDTSFIPPFSNRLTFGIGNDKSFYISNFSYYNTRLSNATLQAITS